MIALAVLVGAAVLPLAITRRGGRRFQPRVWAALGLVTIAGAAVYTWLSLLLLSASVVAKVVVGQAVAGLCGRVLRGLAPGGPVLAWSAAAVLGASIVAVLVEMYRLRRRRLVLAVPPGIGTHAARDGFALVIVPVAAPLAYSLGGRHPQVVISEGLSSRLDDRELAAVLAHEAVHLRSHHSRWLALAALATSALWFVPWVRRSAAACRVALERWADEEAALEVGREILRRALLRAADVPSAGSSVAALNGADALLERLAMLESAPHHARSAFACEAAAVSLALIAIGGAAATGGMSEMLALLGHLCPI